MGNKRMIHNDFSRGIIYPIAVILLFVLSPYTSPAMAQHCCGPGQSQGWNQHSVLNDSWMSSLPTVMQHDDTAESSDDESKDEEEKEKWDVDHPPGPWDDVAIITDEGTWMSLDVSPDGKEIVFDMLGDLYTLPIEGGQAKSLTAGISWDMQPTFSPDGQRVVFTSDRGGGDNIWIIHRDGSDPVAVTDEDFKLLNSPTWTPDGQYIAARKHFTSRRSIGSGEMWLYHHTGGKGLQMTKKPNDQKDVGEPAFSPDGQYLYFSQDTTPGKQFEYNKDPNKQIYVIKRLDRKTGDIEDFVTGPGGSIRPTPSPDGQWLAFVRRVRNASVLFLKDLASGQELPLYDKLERDMQETWAIHGVYPAFAWTPDSKSMVFWASGKIHRIDITSKKVSEIPFLIKDHRQVAKALRVAVEVAPESFDVKLLRWASVSPTGKAVVYQALGHLYRKSLPDGKPTRLTKQHNHFEFYPSFSRDGKHIVYTTFSDSDLGSVRVVDANGGEGRIVSPKPGHYVEPVFSPDGSRIVYRRIGGGYLRSPTWSQDQGVYVIDLRNNKSHLVCKKGSSPQFGTDHDRLFLTRFERKEDKTKRLLISLDLDGSDEHTHYSSENATEFRISPNGQWLAFTERFNAYITPFVYTGREIDIGPKSRAIPITKVSRDAGQFLHWSGDSTQLHWILGQELFSRNLSEAFSFIGDAPDELPDPPETGVNISFSFKHDAPQGSIAFVGGRIITMDGDKIIEDGVIVIDQNRITVVGPRTQITVPNNALTIDINGKTVMPGIVDVHAHGAQGTAGIIPQQNWMSYASLAFGTTTIHDPSNDTNTIFAASELVKAGLIRGPRIFSTGTILYGAKSSFKAVVNSLDDAQSHLRRMKAVGAISVKSYNQPRRDQRQQVITAAREIDMMVVPEGGSLFQHNMTMIVDGHTGIEHAIPVERAYQDVTQLWSASQTGYTPTIVVGYGGIWGENYWYRYTKVWANERLLSFVPRFVIDPRARRRFTAPEEEYNHIRIAAYCKTLVDAGGHVQLGAHGQMAGLAAHWELWSFVQGGMTELQAIRAATIDGARYVGLDLDIGSLEKGKLADFIIIDGNPLEDIRQSESISLTVINGRVFDAKTMNEIGNEPQKRKPFFWDSDYRSLH